MLRVPASFIFTPLTYILRTPPVFVLKPHACMLHLLALHHHHHWFTHIMCPEGTLWQQLTVPLAEHNACWLILQSLTCWLKLASPTAVRHPCHGCVTAVSMAWSRMPPWHGVAQCPAACPLAQLRTLYPSPALLLAVSMHTWHRQWPLMHDLRMHRASFWDATATTAGARLHGLCYWSLGGTRVQLGVGSGPHPNTALVCSAHGARGRVQLA